MWWTIFSREIALYLRSFGEILSMLVLYVMTVTFYVMAQPHGTAPSGAILWVGALLVLALSYHRMYERDLEDGTLDQWAMMPLLPEWLVLAKCLAHWLMTALPLLIISPLLMLFLNYPDTQMLPMIVLLSIGSWCLVLLGSVAGAAGLAFRPRQLVSVTLVLPLALPVLVFGAMASAKPLTLAGGNPELLIVSIYGLVVFPASIAVSAALLRILREHNS